MRCAEDGGEGLLLRGHRLSTQLRRERLRARSLDGDCPRNGLSERIPVVREAHPGRQLGGVLPAVREDHELAIAACGCDRSKKRVGKHLRDLLEAGSKSANWR